MEDARNTNDTPPTPQDPYPRMIIVCIVITAMLLALIFGMLVFDFATRTPEEVQPVTPRFREQLPQQPADPPPAARAAATGGLSGAECLIVACEQLAHAYA